MPKKDKHVLKYNRGEKSMKLLFLVDADTESLLEKIDTCHSNRMHVINSKSKKTYCMWLFIIYTQCLFDSNKNKNEHAYYRGEDSMTIFLVKN